MDDKYIRIRKDYLWKGFAILIIVLLAGLLVFQIYNRMEEKEENEYTPVEYVDVTYDDLKSKITNKEDCFICGSPEMSLICIRKTVLPRTNNVCGHCSTVH